MRLGDNARDHAAGAPEAAFWRSHVHIGVALYAAGAAGVLAYTAATPGRPHRGLIMAMDGLSLLASVTVFWSVGLRLVSTRWRVPFLCGWTVSTLAVIGCAAVLDGGIASPLTYLLVLPLLFAGLAYTPTAVGWLGGAAVATVVAVGVTTPRPQVAQMTVMTMAVAIAALLTLAGARNRQRLHDELVALADSDGLTGSLTRRAFHDRLYHEAGRAARHHETFSVVMADVDDLKAMNDNAGHGAGDRSLQTLVAVLRASLRTVDLVGRLGGDEFAILLPATDADDVATAVERLHTAVAAPSSHVGTTVSFGAATWAGPNDSVEELLRRADVALYAAKHARRRPALGLRAPAEVGDPQPGR